MAATMQDELVDCGEHVVFCEHTAETKAGRKMRFGPQELAAVVHRCNRRIQETGDYAAVIVGHTSDSDDGEERPLSGLAGPFAVKRIGDRWCVTAKFRMFRGCESDLLRYPRKSVELWTADTFDEMFFDPVSLLGGSAPRLDLGIEAVSPAKFRYFGEKVRYQKHTTPAIPKGNTMNPIVQELLAAVEATDWCQWIKQQMAAEAAGTGQPAAPLDVDSEEEGRGESPHREKFQKARDLALRTAKRKAMRGQPVDYAEELAAARDRLGV